MPGTPATPDAASATASRTASASSLPAAFDAACREAVALAMPVVPPMPAAPAVEVRFFDLARWRSWLPGAVVLLDAAELARVGRRHRARDRDDLALAYALHRLVLGRALACEPTRVALGRDAVGAPVVAGVRLHTSLSHTDGCVAVAVSHSGVVGVDVEPCSRMASMAEIAGQVLHPDEAQVLARCDRALHADALLQLWVRKEALLKAAGIGLAREMSTVAVPAGRALALPLAEGGDGPGQVVVHMLPVGSAWRAALACTPAARIDVAWLHPPAR